MSNVHVVAHPLVQHKLTLMRDKTVSTKGFRQLMNEIGMLLAYEVTRDLPLEVIEVETPLTKTMAPTISGKKLVFAPILRAGVGFLDGMLNLVPSARVAHIGLYRDPNSLGGGRILFQSPSRRRGPAGDRHGPDARHRQFGGRGHRPPEAAWGEGYPIRLSARRARGDRTPNQGASGRADLDRGD